jgi:hypothetical protein
MNRVEAMAEIVWWALPTFIVLTVVVVAALLWRPFQGIVEEIEMERARESFTFQRERLELYFILQSARSGKPRGLQWKDSNWENEVEFARDRRTRKLLALVGVTIFFEALPDSEMEDNPNVGTPRNATAIFVFERGQWLVGRALFNMNPDEALTHFKTDYERLEIL